jgi:hypothetical protein
MLSLVNMDFCLLNDPLKISKEVTDSSIEGSKGKTPNSSSFVHQTDAKNHYFFGLFEVGGCPKRD